MNTLNKICTVLTVIFAVFLVLLVAQIVYVLCRRRRFHSRDGGLSSTSADMELSTEASSFSSSRKSKQFLYFLCLKSQASTRVEPDDHHAEAATSAAAETTSLSLTDEFSDVDEILKRQALYGGPSRVLYTIREEEREEVDMDLSSAEREDKKQKNNIIKKIRSVSLEEVSVSSTAPPSAVVMDVVDDDTTPFSTPCASPPYFTPSPSPSREKNLN